MSKENSLDYKATISISLWKNRPTILGKMFPSLSSHSIIHIDGKDGIDLYNKISKLISETTGNTGEKDG